MANTMPSRSASKHKQMGKNEHLTHTLVTIAPDGGWGWVILFVSTWDCLCIDGMSLGYSVIQDAVTEHLKISSLQSSMFVSIFNCIVYLNGPIIAAVANRFGFKILNVLGGFICAVALIVCFWASSFTYMLVFFSITAGIGGSMIYMVSMTAPGYWFEARRSLAFGVASSATGFAALGIPPIAKFILSSSDWNWVLVFLAGLFTMAFIFGFLVKKPPMMLVEVEDRTALLLPRKDQTVSIINIRAGGGRTADDKLKQLSQHANIHSQKPAINKRLSDPSIIFNQPSKWSKILRCLTCSSKKKREYKLERPMYKSDIFLHSRTNEQTKRYNPDYALSLHKMTTERDIRQQLDQEFVCCPEAITRPLKEMLALSLLKNVVYVILLIGTMAYYSAIYVTYLFIPRTSLRKGVGEEIGIFTLQVFGLAIAVSRILLGLVFHFFPEMPPHYFTGFYVVTGGICHMSLSLTTSKLYTPILGALSGFFVGVLIPMRSVLIVRYIGIEKLTSAMGLLFVFQAIGSLYGAPVAEALSEAFNEDYVMYYFAGAMYTLAGLLVLPLEIINKLITKEIQDLN